MALSVGDRVALARYIPVGDGNNRYNLVPMSLQSFGTVAAVAGALATVQFDNGVFTASIPDIALDKLVPTVGVTPRMVRALAFVDNPLAACYDGLIIGAYSRILQGTGVNKGEYYLTRMLSARGTLYFEGLASDFETLEGR